MLNRLIIFTGLLLLFIGLVLQLHPTANAQDGGPSDPGVLSYTVFQDDLVEGAVWSPDGAYLLGRDLQMVYVWEADTGIEVVQLPADASIITARWNATGTRVLVLNADRVLNAYDVPTGELILSLEDVVEFEWSDDDRHVMTINYLTVQVWDIQTTTQVIEVSETGVFTLSPAGDTLMAWSDGIILWDLNDPAAPPIEIERGNIVGFAGWSPDGTTVAAVFFDGTIRLLEAASGQILQQIEFDLAEGTIPGQVLWNASGDLVAAQTGAAVRVWDVESGDEVLTVETNGATVDWLRWDATGTQINMVLTDEFATLQSWDAASGEMTFNLVSDPLLREARWSADGAYIALRIDGTGLQIRRTADLVLVFSLNVPLPPRPLWHPVAPRYLTVFGNLIEVWDMTRATRFVEADSSAVLDGPALMVKYECFECHFAGFAESAPQLTEGIAGQERTDNTGNTVIADADYLRESILEPNAFIVEGYRALQHPVNYAEQISEEELAIIIEYLLALPE